MADMWPANVVRTYELGSQRGPGYSGECSSFDATINAFLKLGWRILNTYIEDKDDSHRQECVVLLGWASSDKPRLPGPYQSYGSNPA
jgi:hypothetical protein